MSALGDAVARATTAWHARLPRERLMLAIMFAALAAFAYWYGGVLPLRGLAGAARASYDREAATLLATRANLSIIRAAREAAPKPPAGDDYPATILAAAQAAGVSVSRQRMHGDGGLAVGIDAVDGQDLFAWLDTLQAAHGIMPDTLQVGRRDGRLHAEASFRGPRP